jgi:hypothetical protein
MPVTWRDAFSNKKFLLWLVAWLTGLTLFIYILPHYFNGVIANKPGIVIDDFLFNFLTPRDWSTEIFFLIIGAPALFFVCNYASPEKILLSIQCYVVVNFMRLASLYLFTLETPEGIIPLVDPFLQIVAYGGNAVFTKDLFFSGHTSTLFIIFLIEDRPIMKLVLLLSTGIVGLMLVWQRVHYSVDIVGAILVTLVVFKGITWVNDQTLPAKQPFS